MSVPNGVVEIPVPDFSEPRVPADQASGLRIEVTDFQVPLSSVPNAEQISAATGARINLVDVLMQGLIVRFKKVINIR
jgi:hypothetical protein